ncbi:MAG: tryptophanyl-tRNA synthetase [Actinomycetia bacterium]|nr:tryptophanyl-tRNA synthetase [Actinomycetes bacterium]
MPRVFSGIKPTGDMHLGNYVGAVGRWVEDQDRNDALFCVVDLHALTMPWDPAQLTARTREVATLLMAAGLDPDRCTLFVQSHVPEHSVLTWLLNNVATYGELRRMTQFKDKSATHESLSVGFFDYPVLMASDILLYDTDEVPVGDDQRQHVELTRDIAQRFNHRFGQTFVLPKATFPPAGARVMDLQNPTKKMSKSEDSPEGTVLVLDDPKVVAKKIKRAVTDSGSEVRYDPDEKPGVSNLLELHAALSGGTIAASEKEFAGLQYGALKSAVAEVTVEALRPVRERYAELSADPAELDRLLAIGAEKARSTAAPVLERAYRNAGLLMPAGLRRTG